MNLSVALRLGRVSNLPTTWTNVLAGLALSGAARSVGEALWLCVAVSLFYVGGMYLNDAFDRKLDALQRPQRPIPSGAVSAATVFAIGFGLLGLGMVCVAWLSLSQDGGGSMRIWAACGLAALIVFYDAFHKSNPLSPVVMGLTRAVVYVLAALPVAPARGQVLLIGCATLLSYLIGLTYVAKQETLKQFRGAWALILLALPLLHIEALRSVQGAVLYALLVGWTAYALSFLWRAHVKNIPQAVSMLIAGISLVDGLLITVYGAPTLGLLCICGLGLTRWAQRHVPGT